MTKAAPAEKYLYFFLIFFYYRQAQNLTQITKMGREAFLGMKAIYSESDWSEPNWSSAAPRQRDPTAAATEATSVGLKILSGFQSSTSGTTEELSCKTEEWVEGIGESTWSSSKMGRPFRCLAFRSLSFDFFQNHFGLLLLFLIVILFHEKYVSV
jgi:hypothetical protein